MVRRSGNENPAVAHFACTSSLNGFSVVGSA
jgi:hypothetical protein